MRRLPAAVLPPRRSTVRAGDGVKLRAAESKWERVVSVAEDVQAMALVYINRFTSNRFARGAQDFFHSLLVRMRPFCQRTIDRVTFQTMMFSVTVYALLGDDIRLSSSASDADMYFNIVTLVTLMLFTFEILISCIGKEDYFLSFFFILDLVATASLILDVTWIYENIILGGSTGMARAGRMSRVGTRAGRVIRVIRLIRLIRIVKLYRHVFDVVLRLQGTQDTVEASRPGGTDQGADEEVYAESRVGQKLSQMTTQKVIVLILTMLIVLPNISSDAWFKVIPSSAQYGADVLNRLYLDCQRLKGRPTTLDPSTPPSSLACRNFELHLTLFIGQHARRTLANCQGSTRQAFDQGCKMNIGWIGIKTDVYDFAGFGEGTFEEDWKTLFGASVFGAKASDIVLAENRKALDTGRTYQCDASPKPEYRYIPLLSDGSLRCPGDLRIVETLFVEPQLIGLQEMSAIFVVVDVRPWSVRTAVYSIMQTFFICLILAVGAMIFSRDANVLVLQPIERMNALVEKIRANPLYAMKLGDEAYRETTTSGEDDDRGPLATFVSHVWTCIWRGRAKEQTLETKVLENAIVKLGKLLALGFGEAGTEIIIKNMGDDTATVNAMIPGKKVQAVFGFCNIHDFAATTEVLQDKVMVFVNQVSEIVHSIVDTWQGAANRNNGQAFLIVWRMRDEYASDVRCKVCDMSVMSFVQVLSAINKSAVLKDYREHPALLARIPNYRVRMGFGLHYGWAIEGAIGSDFKIDASYISPHVNMASRLEALTRTYRVSILVSEPLARLVSAEMRAYFRIVDYVTLGGMSTPIRLHALDLNAEGLDSDYIPPPRDSSKIASRTSLIDHLDENPYEVRRQREKAKEEKMSVLFEVTRLFEKAPDLRMMRADYPARFFQAFKKGYFNYEAGEWTVAKEVFEGTFSMLKLPWPDGPSQALLEYMAGLEFDSSRASPKGWLGYRELNEA